jgi:opacity protein-like surface antigen
MHKKILGTSLFLLATTTFAAPGTYVQGQAGLITIDMPSQIYWFIPNPGIIAAPTGRLSLGKLWGDNTINYGLESGVQFYNTDANSSASAWGNQYKEQDSLDGYNIDLLGVYQYNFNGGINVFAKGGLAYVRQTLNTKVWTNNQLTTNESGTDAIVTPEIGLGVGYQFTPQIGMNFTTNYYFNAPKPNGVGLDRMATAMVGLTYNFG